MASICPQLLSSGTCSDSSCVFKHELLICDLCGVTCTTSFTYNAHMNGKKHRIKASGKNNILRCVACDRDIVTYSWGAHVAGRRHIDAAALKGISPDLEGQLVTTDTTDRNFCDLCRTHVPIYLWARHSSTLHHTRQERYAAFKAVLDEAERDKNGVTVEGSFDFDIVDSIVAHNGLTIRPMIKVAMPQSKIALVQIRLASAKQSGAVSPYVSLLHRVDFRFQFSSSSFSVAIEGENSIITYGKPITIRVEFQQTNNGRYEDRAEFLFEDIQLKKKFFISRALRVIVGNKADHELLRPRAPYVPKERLERQLELNIIEGVAPPSLKAIPYVFKLPEAPIPKALLSTLSNGSVSEMVNRVRKVYLPAVLNSDTYPRHFKHLLWVEEFRME